MTRLEARQTALLAAVVGTEAERDLAAVILDLIDALDNAEAQIAWLGGAA